MAQVRLLAGDMRHVAGSSAYTEELAIRLHKNGHKVCVVCLGASERLKKHCDVIELGRSRWRDARFAWRFSFYLDEWHTSRSLLRASIPDADVVIGLEHMLVRAHYRLSPKMPWIYVPLSLVAPMEIRSYALGRVATWLGATKFHQLQRWALRTANITVRFSDISCRLLESYYGTNCAKRFVTCDMPIDSPTSLAHKPTNSVLNLLIVGRIVESKNLDLAVRILSKLRHLPWKLDIVGDGPHLSHIREQIRTSGLEDRITCHGRVPSTSDWYRKADLFLFTSKLDNCPLVVLESMSYGVPVLAVRSDGRDFITGVDEMILHGRDGLLADGVGAFAELLSEILQNPRTLEQLGTMARRRIQNQNTWDAHIAFFERTFAQIVDEGKLVNIVPVEPKIGSATSDAQHIG